MTPESNPASETVAPVLPAMDPPPSSPPSPSSGDAGSEAAGVSGAAVWRALGLGISAAGVAVGRAAVAVGRVVADGYLAVDPDVRRHAAQLPLLGLITLVPHRAAVAALPDDGHNPVVFVHGLGGRASNFLLMRGYFSLMGRSRTYAVGFDSSSDLDAMAARLADFLDEVATVNGLGPDARIDVVAHSMGGMIARLALDHPRAAARVGTLVTLGSPHGGTFAARYAHTTHTLQLRPDSDVVKRLAAQLPWPGPPARPRLVAFWSATDMLLLPPTAACVDGADNIEMEKYTHYSYLLHPGGWQRVFDSLGRGPARA